MVPETRVAWPNDRKDAPWGWATAAIGAVALTMLLLLGGVAEAAPSPVRFGDPATPHGVIPTLMGRFATLPVDLDGDGPPETLILSTDGVMHRYDDDGRFAWALDTQDVLSAAGRFGEVAGHFLGPMTGQLAAAPAGPVFTDLNGDNIQDVIAVMLVAEDAPANRFHSAVVRADGANGQILDVTLHDGVIRTLLLDDLNGDGQPDLFLAAEDGPETATDHHTIGTGGPFRAWLEDPVTREEHWNLTLDLPWSTVTAATTAQITGSYPDVVLAYTEPLDAFVPDLDLVDQPVRQRLMAIGGTVGGILWDTPTDESLVREIIPQDLDADGVDDLVLRIQEQEERQPSLGDRRGRIDALSGVDASRLWNATDFGHLPVLHDIVYLPTTDGRIAVAFTERSTATYPAEDIEKVRLLRPTGTAGLTHRLDTSSGITLDFIEGTFSVPPVERPSVLSPSATIDGMRLGIADIDDDGQKDLITASSRGMNGVRVTTNGAVTLWSQERAVDRETLHIVARDSGDEIWTQDVDTARVVAYRTADGQHVRTTPLVGLVTALERADLTGNHDLDRIIGGASRTVFALEGDTRNVLWQRSLGAAVIDLKATDATKDGTPDLIAITTHGVALIDGSDGTLRWSHTHEGAAESAAWHFGDFDGDKALDVVVGTRQVATDTPQRPPAQVQLLRTADGETLWSHLLPPHLVRVTGIATGDIDQDGVPEVAVTAQTATAGATYSVGTIDGAKGLLKWRIELPGHGGRSALERHPVQMVDADGDSRLDVVVALPGGPLGPAALRAHSGTTGLQLWERATDAEAALTHVGLWKGFVGPSGAESLIVASTAADGTRLTLLTPRAGPITAVDYPGLTHLTDLQTGEVNGDGIHDILLASPQGITVINAGPTVAGSTTHLGHLTTWSATKARLVDLDGDGRGTIQFFSHERSHPVAHGSDPFLDAGRGKAVGNAAMAGTTPPPPVEEPPVAKFSVTNEPVQGEPVEFQSTSFAKQGSLVNQTWTFDDGAEKYGPAVNHTWPTPGSKTVTLTVMDTQGRTGSVTQTIEVRPVYGHVVTSGSFAGYASPGDTYRFNVSVENIGVEDDLYDLLVLSAPDGWNVTLLGGTTHSVAAGANHTYEAEVTIDVARPRGEVRLGVRSQAMETTETVNHRIFVPLSINASLFGGSGPYGPLDEIGGSATVTWHDGTPVPGLELQISRPDGESIVVTTDVDGNATFVVPKDLFLAHSPGHHRVYIDPVYPNYDHGRNLRFSVEATA